MWKLLFSPFWSWEVMWLVQGHTASNVTELRFEPKQSGSSVCGLMPYPLSKDANGSFFYIARYTWFYCSTVKCRLFSRVPVLYVLLCVTMCYYETSQNWHLTLMQINVSHNGIVFEAEIKNILCGFVDYHSSFNL